MPYFDAPPGQRVLREFTIRGLTKGRWLVVSAPNAEEWVFEYREAAERHALGEAEGDLNRVHFLPSRNGL